MADGTQGMPSNPSAQDPAPPRSGLTCSAAEVSIRRFASGGLTSGERAELREHCAGCEACQAHYSDVVATLARLGRDRRITRVAREKSERRESLRRDVFEAQASKRWDRGRLRALVYPALIAWLFIALGQRIVLPEGAQVLAQGPEVWLRGQVLTPDHGQAALRAGDRLATGPGGRATIAWQATEWKLGQLTEVRLEALRPLSLRLWSGQAEVHGPFVGFLPMGLLRADGPARVRIEGEGAQWSVEVLEGDVVWAAADGEQRLPVGTSWQP